MINFSHVTIHAYYKASSSNDLGGFIIVIHPLSLSLLYFKGFFIYLISSRMSYIVVAIMKRQISLETSCQSCGLAQKKHYALGFCYNCYMRAYTKRKKHSKSNAKNFARISELNCG